MKRLLWSVCILVLFSSCQNDQSAQQQAVQSTAPAPTPAAKSVPSAPSVVGSITLSLGQVNAKVGETICVPVSVASFQQILSTQYSINWDPNLLTFKGFKGFQLQGMGAGNFGTPLAPKGILTCVWIDETLKGVSLPDGTVIYEVCYEVNANAGGQGIPIQFSDQPTPYESVNLQEQLMEIIPINGGIQVK